MTNLKNEVTKTMATKIQSFKGWSILLGLVLVATTTGAALAYNSGAKGRSINATFTKWVTTPPNMVGEVGGDVGPGTYAGEILSLKTDANTNITSIEALYHLNGSKYAFTAKLNITQDDSKGKATITGFVTEGSERWLEGASVTGEYQVVPDCRIETPGNAYGTMCFRGVLHVRPK